MDFELILQQQKDIRTRFEGNWRTKKLFSPSSPSILKTDELAQTIFISTVEKFKKNVNPALKPVRYQVLFVYLHILEESEHLFCMYSFNIEENIPRPVNMYIAIQQK